MGRTITITDTTLRDGHQSLWAARMSTEWMIPVAQRLESSRIPRVDVLGHAHLMWAVRFMREDPWERIRRLRAAMPTPALRASVGGQVTGSFRIAPDDVRQLFMQCAVANGVDYLASSHGILDVDVIVEGMHWAKAAGARTILPLVYSLSPVHTDELFAAVTREVCQRSEVDVVMIKDSGGLLTPERTASLVRALRDAAGHRQLTLHGHCTTGLAGRVYMVGAEAGVDDLQCGIWPLALGTAQPAVQTVVRNLRDEGYDVDVDLTELEAASEYLLQLTEATGLPRGEALEYDHGQYLHQVPGGMMSNLRLQLKEAGLLDRLDEILVETGRVRAELGWPTMVTPYSQFVVNQAMFNVVTGERYKIVPDEVKIYALGGFGRLLAPIDPDVLDRIMVDEAKLSSFLARAREPMVEQLRRDYPSATDEERLLRYMCSASDIEALLAARRAQQRAVLPTQAGYRLGRLIARIAGLTSVTDVSITADDFTLTIAGVPRTGGECR